MRFAADAGEPLFHSVLWNALADDSTTQKLNSFTQLPDGWHFGEGRRAELLAINYAKTLNRIALANGWQTDAFPGLSGEVMLSVENSEHYYEVVIDRDGSLSLVEEVNGEEVQRKEVFLSDLVETISPNSSSCPTYVLFTLHTGSSPKTVSQVWLSKTPAQTLGEEFRSSNGIVLKSKAGPFARTWEPTMTSSSPSRFSSGRSTMEPYRRIA